jgi:hypothetical protein
MPINLNFRDAMHRLAELASPAFPPHVQITALCKLASLLSPANLRYADVMRALAAPPSADDEEASESADDEPL